MRFSTCNQLIDAQSIESDLDILDSYYSSDNTYISRSQYIISEVTGHVPACYCQEMISSLPIQYLFIEFHTPARRGTSSPWMCTTAKGVPPHIGTFSLRTVPRRVAVLHVGERFWLVCPSLVRQCSSSVLCSVKQ